MDVRRAGLTLAVAAGLVRSAAGAAPAAIPEPAGFRETWLRDRLELGVRFSGVFLLDSDRWDPATGKGLVGTIGHLDEDQTAVPDNVSLAYFPLPR